MSRLPALVGYGNGSQRVALSRLFGILSVVYSSIVGWSALLSWYFLDKKPTKVRRFAGLGTPPGVVAKRHEQIWITFAD
jgi:preprotein translocase subunit SecF